MTDRGREARRFFDQLWSESDPWDLDTSHFEQQRYSHQFGLIEGRRYPRALEIGCASGSFTRRLAPLCAEVLAIDVSDHAIERARAAGGVHGGVEFRAVNVMELDLEGEGEWDLVVLAETVYYLGWLYPMFDIAWLAHSLHEATRTGGRLLLVNSMWSEEGLMSPWLIRSYHDLFGNVGYELETEETVSGTKETVEFETLFSLFLKPPSPLADKRSSRVR